MADIELPIPGVTPSPNWAPMVNAAINAINDEVGENTTAISDGSAVKDSAVSDLISDDGSETHAALQEMIGYPLSVSGAKQVFAPEASNHNTYESWPVIASDTSNLFVAYSSGTNHITGEAARNAVILRSVDGGATFTTFVTITASGYDISPDVLFVLNGDLIVVYRKTFVSETAGDRTRTFEIVKYEDFSTTPTTLATGLTPATPLFNPGAVTDEGTLVMSMATLTGWFVYRSVDGGANWSVVTPPNVDDEDIQEPRIGKISGNRLLMIGRTPNDGGMYASVSTDDGVTWPKPVRIPNMPYKVCPGAFLEVNGKVAVVVGSRTNMQMVLHYTTFERFAAGDVDPGFSLLNARALKADDRDFGYPNVAKIGDTHYMVFYDRAIGGVGVKRMLLSGQPLAIHAGGISPDTLIHRYGPLTLTSVSGTIYIEVYASGEAKFSGHITGASGIGTTPTVVATLPRWLWPRLETRGVIGGSGTGDLAAIAISETTGEIQVRGVSAAQNVIRTNGFTYVPR